MRVERPWKSPGVLATGVHGRIAWWYLPAADVAGYIVERDAHGVVTVRAHLTNVDDYKLAQTPLTFSVTLRRGSWTWPILEVLRYADHALTARLGAPVATRHA